MTKTFIEKVIHNGGQYETVNYWYRVNLRRNACNRPVWVLQCRNDPACVWTTIKDMTDIVAAFEG